MEDRQDGFKDKRGITRRDFMKAVAVLGAATGAPALLSCAGSGSPSGREGPRVLARVEVPGYLEDIDLPVHADLEDGAGVYYALVIATIPDMERAGVAYRTIDPYEPGTLYLIANEEIAGARRKAAQIANVLYDDGEHIILRYEFELSDTLPGLGFTLAMMSESPLNLAESDAAYRTVRAATDRMEADRESKAAVTKDSRVQAMMDKVIEADVQTYTEELSGEREVRVENAPYTFTTRHTRSGEPIRKATQFIFEKLKGMNLKPDFHEWTFEYKDKTLANRNVVVDIPGQEASDELIVLVAHLDSITEDASGFAPGADDNASGCVGLLMAADIMRKYKFRRTLRLIFTTGEEQALFGGKAYADKAAREKQKIQAVINMDMISYSQKTDPPSTPRQQVKTRHPKNTEGYRKDLAVAQRYVNVVETYGLDQTFHALITSDGELSSDHSPFWAHQYAAVWVIEYAEEGFINPDMHSKDDRIAIANMSYYTDVIKAVIGSAAHLAEVTG